jgi:glyoxylate carboligase
MSLTIASALVLVASVAVGLGNRVVARHVGRLVTSVTGRPHDDIVVRRISIGVVTVGALAAVSVLVVLAFR